MNRVLVTLMVALLMCTTFCKHDAFAKADDISYSFKKIEKLYARQKYTEVLSHIRALEQARYGKNNNLNYSLHNNVKYYHYKLSARIQLRRYVSLTESMGLYKKLFSLDSASVYASQPHYSEFKEYIRKLSEVALKNNQIVATRKYVDFLAYTGDTTSVYRRVYTKTETLKSANKAALLATLKSFNYSKIDQKARSEKKQSSIANQAWVLTKDYKYDFQKVRAIYIWIVYNIDYDYTYSIYDGETTFKKGTGVCNGFSYLFQEMCEAAGIKAYRLVGKATSLGTTGLHAWNAVEIAGEQLLIDSTWASCVKEWTDYYYLISEKDLYRTNTLEKIY